MESVLYVLLCCLFVTKCHLTSESIVDSLTCTMRTVLSCVLLLQELPYRFIIYKKIEMRSNAKEGA